MISLALSAVLSGLVMLIILAIDRNNRSGLKAIPAAHFTAPFSNLWLLGVRWRSEENRVRIDLHRRLGPVVRLGPDEVGVDDVDEGLRIVYSNTFSKSDWARRAFLCEDEDILVTMKTPEEHKKRRAMLANVYSKTNILASLSLDNGIAKVDDRLNELISGWAESGDPVEYMQWAKASIMDITTGWCFGTEYGTNCLSDDAARQRLAQLIDGSFSPPFWRVDVPGLTAVLRLVGIKLIPESSTVARDELRQWIGGLMARASTAAHSRSIATATMFEQLQDNMKIANPGLSGDRIRTLMARELFDHVIASYELTSIALTYVMYELSRSLKTQQALREELSTLSSPNDKPRAQRIDELPILGNVVTETLRVRPPGIGPWPRVVPEGGCRLAGRYDIPGGTTVSASAWTIHGHENVFPAPWKWRPERWSEANAAELQEMRKWFWAFGSGARICIAMHFATRVIKELLIAVYTDFETVLDEQFAGSMEQFDGLLGLPMSNSLHIKFRRV